MGKGLQVMYFFFGKRVALLNLKKTYMYLVQYLRKWILYIKGFGVRFNEDIKIHVSRQLKSANHAS